MAGAPGFEPGNAGIKIRCLTAWRRPNNLASHTTYNASLGRQDCSAHPCAAPLRGQSQRDCLVSLPATAPCVALPPHIHVGRRRICRTLRVLILPPSLILPAARACHMAGAPGFEPGNAGIKIRCLTAWRRPKNPGTRQKGRATSLMPSSLSLVPCPFQFRSGCTFRPRATNPPASAAGRCASIARPLASSATGRNTQAPDPVIRASPNFPSHFSALSTSG